MAKCECCGQSFFAFGVHPIVKDAFGTEHKICMDCYKKCRTPGKSAFYDFANKKVVIKDVVEYRKSVQYAVRYFAILQKIYREIMI